MAFPLFGGHIYVCSIFLNVCRLNNTGWEIPGHDSDFFCGNDPVHDTVRSSCEKPENAPVTSEQINPQRVGG